VAPGQIGEDALPLLAQTSDYDDDDDVDDDPDAPFITSSSGSSWMRLLSSATMGWRGLISMVFCDMSMLSLDGSCIAWFRMIRSMFAVCP
jgi:hypothetical protein